MGTPLSRQLTHRFFRYLAITSQSDPSVKTLPSTPGQHEMARELAQELAQLGLDRSIKKIPASCSRRLPTTGRANQSWTGWCLPSRRMPPYVLPKLKRTSVR